MIRLVQLDGRKRIRIIGSVASGKTTLAKELSEQLCIPYYELDNVVWERLETGDRRRTEAEMETYLQNIINAESWIIEGVHHEAWTSPTFQSADVIYYLDTRYSVRTYRIIKRFIMQKLGLEKANYRPTVGIFFKMFKWNRHYEQVGKPRFFEKNKTYHEKIVVVSKQQDVIKDFQS